MKSVPPSDQMRASGSGRRKVALPPGRSQLDWVRNSTRLPRLYPRTISLKELRKHRARDDAWVAVHSKVFDVTPYIEYHPGGVDMMLAGAGKDATKLFNKYHAWVNVDFMLARCYLGMLDTKDTGDESGYESDGDEEDSEATSEGRPAPTQGYPNASRVVKPEAGDPLPEDLKEKFDALNMAEIEE